jgi:DNA-binding Xre family transcriptional regulator
VLQYRKKGVFAMIKKNVGVIQNRFRIAVAEKETRDKRSYSYRDIQDATGVSTSTLVDWATGKSKNYAGDTIAALCYFFGCAVGDLLVHIPPTAEPPAVEQSPSP